MTRVALLLLALAHCATAEASLTATVTHPGCPAACRTVIDMRIGQIASRGAAGALFLGVLPAPKAGGDYGPGGYFTGDSWMVSVMPVPWFTGPLLPMRKTVTIEGGLCSNIESAGGPSGRYDIVIGYGLHADLDGEEHELAQLKASLPSGATDPEIAALISEYEQALASAKSSSSQGLLAAQNMIERGTRRVVARVNCP